MAVGDIFRVAVNATIHGQVTINTFYWDQIAGGVDTPFNLAGNLANAILAAPWWGFYDDLHSNEWSAILFQIAQVSASGMPIMLSPTYETNIVDNPGDFVGDSLPSSVALVIKRRTDIPGRKGFGRIFLTAVPVAWEADSRIDDTDVNFSSAMTGFLANVGANMTNGGITWRPVHYMPSLTLVSRAQPIRIWSYDSVLRNQRRRQPGVGI
jgi:hypothetical protein